MNDHLYLIQIDYQTFLTLSDEDLKEVGVSTFGARRKMLLAISGENLEFTLNLLLRLCLSKWLTYLSADADLNKNKRRLSDTPAVKPGYLEGGASGRLPRIVDLEIGAQSNRWWEESAGNRSASDQQRVVWYLVHWCQCCVSLQRKSMKLPLKEPLNQVIRHITKVLIQHQDKEVFPSKARFCNKQTILNSNEPDIVIMAYCNCI